MFKVPYCPQAELPTMDLFPTSSQTFPPFAHHHKHCFQQPHTTFSVLRHPKQLLTHSSARRSANMAVGTNTPRNAPRGPASGRRHRGPKTDRDGDLKMDITVKGRAARGGISKSTPSTSSRGGDQTSRTSARSSARGGPASANARGAILRRAAANGDINMSDTRASQTSKPGSLVELKVTGWKNNKASDSADGGASALISWIEKKASNRLGSRARSVKVKKVCYNQHSADYRTRPTPAMSGPPSFAANLRTTTAIQVLGQRLPDG